MKYAITVNEKTYQVEIEDIHARPIVARVDGVRFEVMPENGGRVEIKRDAIAAKTAAANLSPAAPSHSMLSDHTLTAPLPGTVTEVFVKAGDQVEMGQVILIIEAMKMKNSIRSTHSGRIKETLVSAGQSVTHKQALARFEE